MSGIDKSPDSAIRTAIRYWNATKDYSQLSLRDAQTLVTGLSKYIRQNGKFTLHCLTRRGTFNPRTGRRLLGTSISCEPYGVGKCWDHHRRSFPLNIGGAHPPVAFEVEDRKLIPFDLFAVPPPESVPGKTYIIFSDVSDVRLEIPNLENNEHFVAEVLSSIETCESRRLKVASKEAERDVLDKGFF